MAELEEHRRRIAVLEASHKDLEDFALAVSRDLQGPLKQMESFAGLAKASLGPDVPDITTSYIDRIAISAKQAARMIEKVLEFSRRSAADKPLEAVQLNSLLEDVVADLALAIDQTEAHVRVDALPPVLARRDQLYHVFYTLIQNAIKHRRAELPVITVGAKRDESQWMFWVKDNGKGIDECEWDHIFHLFRRPDQTKIPSSDGLGLPMCKKIIERHGGRIWLNSKENAGTTFYFTLPANEGDA